MRIKIGNRVVISGTATTPKKARRQATVRGQKVGAHRIVFIKDGQFVRDKPNR